MPRPAQPVLPFEEPSNSTTNLARSVIRTSPPTLEASSARALGAYYTPPTAAEFLARWTLRDSGDRVLEPSMGDGVFLHALRQEAERRGLATDVWGIEMAADTFRSTIASGVIGQDHGIHRDFLSVQPFDVDAVVGNPPYVRLRHVSPDQARRARKVAEQVLGQPMDPSGSIWMPFVLHASRFLRPGGRVALVLPYDLTYVRYARPLWDFLARRFGKLRVVRVHERMFPDILQETVLLLADDFCQETSRIRFEAYETVGQLDAGRPVLCSEIEITDVINGERAFLEALLSDDARHLLRTRIALATVPARELVTFNIGYVCGDKKFFHPTPETIEAYGLTAKSLRPALTSARQLRGIGLRTALLPSSRFSKLFLPGEALTQGERAYVNDGEALGVSERYKCRIRHPWYVTPYVRTPDLLLPVFTEKPPLLLNDAQVVASNSLLCGYVKRTSAEALVSAWFTSLTLLQLELQVHALGGGVLVLVPREAGNVRLPPMETVDRRRLSLLHELLTEEKVDLAFASGDESVLRKRVGLSSAEVAVIQEAVDTLSHWRTAARSPIRANRSSKDVHEQQAAFEGVDHAIHEGGDMKIAARH
jgi:adenine-specific DNA-methyltransferase